MKGFVLGALLVTFMAGMSTGVLVGRKTAPVPHPRTWIDINVDKVRERGVTGEEDLERIREIYREYDLKVQALKSQLNEAIRDQVRSLSDEAAGKIQAIIDSYGRPQKAPPGK